MVTGGIADLNAAYKLAADNPFFKEDCLWYLGKAYLMLEKRDEAVKEFQTIVEMPEQNILRREKAKKIIESIRETK